MKRYIKSAVTPLSDESYEVKRSIINDDSALLSDLLSLLHDKDPSIRIATSIRLEKLASTNSNDRILKTIIDIKDFALCYDVIDNPNASSEVLDYLCDTFLHKVNSTDMRPDAIGMILWEITQHRNTSIETLQLLTDINLADVPVNKSWVNINTDITKAAKEALIDRGYDI